MADPVKNCVYELFGYRVTDLSCDGVLTKDEVRTKDEPEKYRELNPEEWEKFAESGIVRYVFGFTPIHKKVMDAEAIIHAIESNPNVLREIINEMGGVGFVILTLEAHLFNIPPEKTAKAAAKLKEWETEFNDYSKSISAADAGAKRNFVSGILELSAAASERGGQRAKTARRLLTDEKLGVMNPETLDTLAEIFSIPSFIMGKKQVQYELEATLTNALLDNKTDCDRYSALYVHLFRRLAEKRGLEMKIYIFNSHVTVIFESKNLPGGRIIIESTSGMVIDLDAYQNSDLIACLKIAPASAYERGPETIVVSPLHQYANDMMDSAEMSNANAALPAIAVERSAAKKFFDELRSESRLIDTLYQMAAPLAPFVQDTRDARYNEALRYLKIIDGIRPSDPSVYVLFQMINGMAGRHKDAEEWRQRLVGLTEKFRSGL